MRNCDPEKNFEELWPTFNNRYPFFEVRNVNWKKQYETYRPNVASQTSDDELFGILCKMLEPLNDGHVSLTATHGEKRLSTLRKSPGSGENSQTGRDQEGYFKRPIRP